MKRNQRTNYFSFLFLKSNWQDNKKSLFVKRMYAFLIDINAIFMLKIMLVSTYFAFIKKYFYSVPLIFQKSLFAQIGFIDNTLNLVLITGYFTFSMYASNGKTLGKFIMNLRVVRENEKPIALWQAFVRTIIYLSFTQTFFLTFLPNLFSKKFRGLADSLSRCHTELDSSTETINEESIENQRVASVIYLPPPQSILEKDKKSAS